jgi:SNARE protein
MSKARAAAAAATPAQQEPQLYEQETRLEQLFSEMKAGFKKLDGVADINKQNNLLKDLTNKMQEAKTLIKDFEKEARMDGMSAVELAHRKKGLVQQLNEYIGMKKERAGGIAAKQELIGTAKKPAHKTAEEMSTGDLIIKARKEIKESDESLIRSEKIVAQTIEVGTKTAETLHDQTKQLERVVDDLDQIHFSLKKASKVIRDITRQIATDKCIMGLVMLMVLGIVVVIVMHILKFPKGKSLIPGQVLGQSGRKLLQSV